MDQAHENICAWLKEHWPVSENVGLNFVRDRKRKVILNAQLLKGRVRARIPLQWREQFAARTKLSASVILELSNTIVDEIESELKAGGKVAITGFGDVYVQLKETTKSVAFRPDKRWTGVINEPNSPDDLGLRRKAYGRGRLEYRAFL